MAIRLFKDQNNTFACREVEKYLSAFSGNLGTKIIHDDFHVHYTYIKLIKIHGVWVGQLLEEGYRVFNEDQMYAIMDAGRICLEQ